MRHHTRTPARTLRLALCALLAVALWAPAAPAIAVPDIAKVWANVIESAVRYARIRTDWRRASLDERRAMDEVRTRAHNAFIDDCNLLSRTLVQHGGSAKWRRALGDDRKQIGDFACYIHCYLGLQAR